MAPLKPTDAVLQLGWYLIVGGSAFVVDIGCFLALATIGFPVLLASASSFLIATLANYFLSCRLAFTRGRFDRVTEIARFCVVVLVGLALNTFFVWLFITYTTMWPVVAKVAAVPLVFGWNFLGRRLIVFRPELPSTTLVMTQSLITTFENLRTDPALTKAPAREASRYKTPDG